VSLEQHKGAAPARLRFAVITISDTRDAASDRGGPYLVERVEAAGHSVAQRAIVKDEREQIEAALRAAVADTGVDLVLTTGGTGIAPRDVTYDTLKGLFDSEIPGFGELFRMLSYQQIGAAALLSRAIGGVLAGKVVLAMPGSPKALALAMDEIVLREAAHLVQQTRARP
jgi:molybdenum cofactor biosynthesis protein B